MSGGAEEAWMISLLDSGLLDNTPSVPRRGALSPAEGVIEVGRNGSYVG